MSVFTANANAISRSRPSSEMAAGGMLVARLVVASFVPARQLAAWLGSAGPGWASQDKVAIAAAKIGCGGMNVARRGSSRQGLARQGWLRLSVTQLSKARFHLSCETSRRMD